MKSILKNEERPPIDTPTPTLTTRTDFSYSVVGTLSITHACLRSSTTTVHALEAGNLIVLRGFAHYAASVEPDSRSLDTRTLDMRMERRYESGYLLSGNGSKFIVRHMVRLKKESG
jgi:hypothetical protein